MRRSLLLHPGSHSTAVRTIEVDVERPSAQLLNLRYTITGNIAGIALPPPGDPVRTEELWLHTCFEAFARRAGSVPYIELNFAPSRAWAAYAFESERHGMQDLEMSTPKIAVKRDAETLALEVTLSLERLAQLPNLAAWQLALSAVIEERDGKRSYWALTHPKPVPDFHHSDCFALELHSPSQS